MMLLALMMVCASVASWIVAGATAPGVRSYLRLASVLFSALGVAAGVDASLANTVGLVAAAIGPVCLALAMLGSRTLPHSLVPLVLAAAAASGMAAAAMNMMAPAFAPLVISVAVMAGCATRDWKLSPVRAAQGFAASLCFLAGACVFVGGGPIAPVAMLLFSSAGLLGISLSRARDSDAAVEQERTRDLRDGAVS